MDVVAIGISTGGPSALAELLPGLAPDFPVPVLIVQHMPALFTALLADRLARISAIAVCEARDGQRLLPATAYIAPGDQHIEVVGGPGDLRARLRDGPPENSCRPAVDVLLRSLVRHLGGGVLAAIMTGIGRDGLRGCQQVHAAGGEVIVQDEATSVVWGMPKAVLDAGLAAEVLPLRLLSASIARRVMRGRCALPSLREDEWYP